MRALLTIGLLACADKSAPDKSASDTSTLPADTDTPIAAPDDTADDTGEPTAPSGCHKADGSSLADQTCTRAADCTWEGGQLSAFAGYAIAAGRDVDGEVPARACGHAPSRSLTR